MRSLQSTTRGTSIAWRGRSVERRQLTVLFCDLIDSTALFAEFDPEDMSELLRSYLRCCAERIEAAGGFTAQYQGDAAIGYFGYSQASESDAERAVRAAIELVELVPRLPAVRGRSLKIRIGIATGLVVVGDPSGEGTRLEQGVVGEAVHLAARLQALASANEIIISDKTKRLTGSLFVNRDLGKLVMKGFRNPVQAWRVLGPRPATNQFRVTRDQMLTQIEGRDAEIDRLSRTWQRVVSGQGQLITITGEAGIGKSRLIREFRHRIARENHFWLESGGSQFYGNTPFFPVAQMIRRALDPSVRIPPAEFQSRLENALEQGGVASGDVLPLLAKMLDLPAPDALPAFSLPPREQRARLFTTIVDWIRGCARLRPLVIVLEDLHWVDASSLELAGEFLAEIGSMPVLMLHSARTGFRPPWRAPAEASELRLKPLADNDLRKIITRLVKPLGGDDPLRIVSKLTRTARPLTDQEMTRVIQRAGGVPLFGIELARLVREQRTQPGDHQIPASLSDLLMARLDQLGTAKNVAQLASVIGNEVPFQVLEVVSDISTAALRSRISALKKHGILKEQEGKAKHTYSFTHALLRDAAYESLLKSKRRDLHRRVATAMSDRFSAVAASRPELLAYHWTNAGELQPAIAAWQRAGEFAGARSAFKEAEQACQNAISVLLELPPSPERDATELTLQSLLADALRITRGLSARLTREATIRARALADKNGDRAQQLRQAWGAWAAASSSGDYVAGVRLGDQFHRLALADGSPESLANAHMIQMTSRFRIGDLAAAEGYFESGEEYFRDPAFQRRAGLVAQTYGNAAQIIWTLGDDAAAQRRIDHALAIARENDNPFDQVYAQCMTAVYLVVTDRHQQAAELAAKCIELCDQYDVAQFAASSRVVLGRARIGLGFADEGVKLIREGLDRMVAGSIRVAITRYMTWLAEAHVHAGSFREALHSVEEALRINPQELFIRPESVRLRGEIRMQLGMLGEAEQDFLDAIDLANRMGAGRFAERAARSLRNLLREPADPRGQMPYARLGNAEVNQPTRHDQSC